eukprot:CAMPEP_0172838470 /NCGR_PEP_ID=MMETSP1075-20121228/27894_1 /TAXON_ID=2916 /ORGANISM="Ceratium fusus, Strain PA161109" /LENGTH=286 /DNA_ID=CAMNT_0013681991 /DNA_START=24 /DNA_END=884 /DNA_ORIENTATION=-
MACLLMSWARLLLSLHLASATLNVPTKEIATGVHMPVVSIGTGGLERNDTATIVDNWLTLGGRGIDTALIYKNQDVIKQQLANLAVPRDQVFITAKIPGCNSAEHHLETDFKELGVDYIDLMLIHFPRFGDCVKTWKVLEDYHRRGRLKAIGVSNFNKSTLEPLLAAATVRPHVNQIQLNILMHDDDTIAFAAANNITVEAFSPLGRSGHSGDVPHNAAVEAAAAAHHVSTYQVALKWILQHGHLLTFQSTSQEHQKADADLFSFTLTDQEMTTLDQQAASSSFLV